MGGLVSSKLESYWKLLSKVLLWAAFSLLLLAAVYVSFGRMLLSEISNLKTTLENSLSRSLEANVVIDEIEGEFVGLDPNIRISGLSIAASAGEAVTVIESLAFAVDSLASLRNGALSLGLLEAHGVRTSVIQLESGGWQVAGLPRRDAPADPAPVVEFLTNIESLTISDIEIGVHTDRSANIVYLPGDGAIQLRTEGGLRKVAATLNYSRGQQRSADSNSLELIGTFRGNPLTDDDFRSNMHIQVSPIPLPEFLPPVQVRDLNLNDLLVGGSFWFEFEAGEAVLQGELTVPSFTLSHGEVSHDIITDLLASLHVHAAGLWDWQLTASGVRFSLDGETRRVNALKVASITDGTRRSLVGTVPEVDVGPISDVVLRLSENSSFLSERALALIETIQPRGVLENLHIKLLLD